MAVSGMERLRAMSLEELTAVPDIGPVIARNIHDFLREPVNVANIDVLTAAGLRMEVDTDRLASAGNALEGRQSLSRAHSPATAATNTKDIIMAQGGKTRVAYRKRQASFSPAKTWGRQSSKKCGKLGVPIVSEDEFLAMIDGATPPENETEASAEESA